MKITSLLPLLCWLLPCLPCRAADDESYYGKPVVSAGALDIFKDKIQFSDTSAPSGQKLKVISPYNLGVAIGSGGVVDWAVPGTIGSTTPNSGAFTTLSATTPIAVTSGGTGTATPTLTAGANVTISGTWPNQTVASTAVGLVATDLNGGTTLAVNTAYFDTVSSPRTFAALPAGTNGDQITLTFDVTGATQAVNFHTNSTVYRIGENGALSAALSFPVGSHKLSLEKKDAKWFLLDSASVGPESFSFAISDETTAITTGAGKLTWRAPYAGTITAVYAELTTASSSGLPAFDINKNGVSILSTTITIDATETDSADAIAQPGILTTAFAARDRFTFDIDTAGTGAAGAKITILFTR
jgi:hypothetical protein